MCKITRSSLATWTVLCIALFGSAAPAFSQDLAAREFESQSAPNIFSPPRYQVGDRTEFWTWDLTVMPPGFNRTEAQALAVGDNSYVFVAQAVLDRNGVDINFVNDLFARLEIAGLAHSLHPALGIVPQAQLIFGPLPAEINPDPRVVILLSDMGEYNGFRFDGYFNIFDQMTEAEAVEHGQHSNEVNIIYLDIDPAGNNDAHTTASIISHELQHLLSHHRRSDGYSQEAWLSESSAEAAMMFAGYFTDQRAIDRFATRSWDIPLVSRTYVNYGVSALFAAFLVDKLGQFGAFDYMMYLSLPSREAVERAVYNHSGRNTSFDAIFSDFISYLYRSSVNGEFLPRSWDAGRSPDQAFIVPEFTKADTISQLPYDYEGTLRPYSFALFQLARPLGPGSRVEVTVQPDNSLEGVDTIDDCNSSAQVLWKPIADAIAVYAIGCNSSDNPGQLRYKLSIRDE